MACPDRASKQIERLIQRLVAQVSDIQNNPQALDGFESLSMRTLTVLKVSQAARNQSHIPLERVRSYHDRAFDIHVRVVSMKVAE